mgnify:CR=1 FL=1
MVTFSRVASTSCGSSLTTTGDIVAIASRAGMGRCQGRYCTHILLKKIYKVSEDEDLNPKEIYGTMKLAGEIITKGLCSFYNIPYTIIRPSAVYGPTDMNQRVTQIFLEKALKGEQLKIQGKDEKLDFTFVEDLANGCILASTKKLNVHRCNNQKRCL